MAEIAIVVKDKLSGEEFDVDVDEKKKVGELCEAMRKELSLPSKDGKGALTYKFVLQRTGVLLDGRQTLQEAGVEQDDVLSFWGEPTAAVTSTRLRSEYREVIRRFRDNPRINISVSTMPPREYRVTYLLKGPTSVVGGSVEIANEHIAVIQIPENFPRDRPTVRMETPTFHPNISTDGIVCIGDDYYSTESIADVVAKVGNYIQFREFDCANPYRSEVKEWLAKQSDFSPFDDAGFGV